MDKNKEIKCSHSAKLALKSQFGTSEKNTKEFANKAFKEGVEHKETSGRLNKWMTKIFFDSPCHPEMRIYRGKLFLFGHNNVLVTVLTIPSNLLKDLSSMINRK